MNRWLWIPCFLSCTAFAGMALKARVEDPPGGALAGHAAFSGVDEITVLMNAGEVQEKLARDWERYNSEKAAFSRVHRPENRYRKPGILVDESAGSPEEIFVGVVTFAELLPLEILIPAGSPQGEPGVAQPGVPIVVDRRTGEALVFESGQWSPFAQWALNAN